MDKMLTTMDNPYNPHDEYDAWMLWDQSHGYYTAEYVDRLMQENELDDEDVNNLQKVYDEIIDFNITGNYVLV